MKKQIINQGYVTYALTDNDSKIYGMIVDYHICFDLERQALPKKKYYWSQVYCEPGGRYCKMYSIIRKGVLLVDADGSVWKALHKQSKINLCGAEIVMNEAEDAIVERYSVDCSTDIDVLNQEKED